MGWTSYKANYHKNGQIDRKKECDSYFLEGLNRGYFEIKKSRLIGSTYYAAITALKRYKKDNSGNPTNGIEDIPPSERNTYAYVMRTSVNNGEFYYKPISEDMGPAETKCPNSILDLLSPTTNAYANNWRQACRDTNAKNTLSTLPIGAEIEFEYCGNTIRLRKSSPCYQFKKPFWINDANHTYFQKKRIPMNYKIVKEN